MTAICHVRYCLRQETSHRFAECEDICSLHCQALRLWNWKVHRQQTSVWPALVQSQRNKYEPIRLNSTCWIMMLRQFSLQHGTYWPTCSSARLQCASTHTPIVIPAIITRQAKPLKTKDHNLVFLVFFVQPDFHGRIYGILTHTIQPRFTSNFLGAS